MGEVEKPFTCPEQNCNMSFTNEDHLQAHQRYHEIHILTNNQGTLQASSSLLKHTSFIIDQTPTPTRFLKHYEDVTLFQDINLNPFDLEFRKASQNRSFKNQFSLTEGQGISGSLDTPRIIPLVDSDETISSTSHDEVHLPISSTLQPSVFSSIITATVSSSEPKMQRCEEQSGDQDEKQELRKRLTLNVSSASEESQPINIISTPTPVITAGPSVLHTLSINCSTPTLNTPNIITASIPSIPVTDGDLSFSDLSTPGLSPPIHTSTPSINSHTNEHSVRERCEEIENKNFNEAMNISCTSLSEEPNLQNSNNPLPSSPSATILQLLLRLPDGQAIPVEIPATPVGSAVSTVLPNCKTTSTLVTSIVSAYPTSAFSGVITNTTPSLAKMRLKQALASSNTAARPGVAKHSRATTADRIAQMTRYRSLSGGSSNAGDVQEDSNSSCGSAASFCNNNSVSKFSKRRKIPCPEEDPEEKRKKFLERNRVAAVRCREKKKRLVESMLSKSDELNALNQRLQGEVASLRSEVAALKCLLLRHKNCPVTLAMQGEDVPASKIECKDGFHLKNSFARASVAPSQNVSIASLKASNYCVQDLSPIPTRDCENPSLDAVNKIRKRALSLSSIACSVPVQSLSLYKESVSTKARDDATAIDYNVKETKIAIGKEPSTIIRNTLSDIPSSDFIIEKIYLTQPKTILNPSHTPMDNNSVPSRR